MRMNAGPFTAMAMLVIVECGGLAGILGWQDAALREIQRRQERQDITWPQRLPVKACFPRRPMAPVR